MSSSTSTLEHVAESDDDKADAPVGIPPMGPPGMGMSPGMGIGPGMGMGMGMEPGMGMGPGMGMVILAMDGLDWKRPLA